MRCSRRSRKAARGGCVRRAFAAAVTALMTGRAYRKSAEIGRGLIARGVGEISSFSAGGKAFDADALAKCNARAAK